VVEQTTPPQPVFSAPGNISVDTSAFIVYSIIQKAFFIMEHTGVKSVAKAMQLLDYVVEQTLHDRAVPLAELAGVLDCPTNSARNILKTLVDCGYLAQAGHGLYGLGAKVRQLGLLNRLEAPASRQAILAVLRDVASRTGEACVLAGLLQGQRIVAAHVDSTQAIRVDHSVIEEKPFFALPTGRMLAAIADERQLQTVIDRHGLPGKHWDDIDDRDALAAALDDLRTVGCCRMIEADSGLFSLAVPVPSTAGDLPAALGAFAPTFRCTPAQQDELADTLTAAAEKLSAVMPTTNHDRTQTALQQS
jgi:IclR family acetate operon transcriptional repressor